MSGTTQPEPIAPCPFCGDALEERWTPANPKAKCLTQGCKGAQLPVLNLDDTNDIAAWNTRAVCGEPTAAEQAAWHAGLDEGRAQGRASALISIARAANAVTTVGGRRGLPVQFACCQLLASYVFESGSESAGFTLGDFAIDGENTGDWEIVVKRVPTRHFGLT